jgi:hypothetical protein
MEYRLSLYVRPPKQLVQEIAELKALRQRRAARLAPPPVADDDDPDYFDGEIEYEPGDDELSEPPYCPR